MAMTDKKRKTDAAWQRKTYKRLGVKLYKGDAEAFEEFCRASGKSVNATLREYVAQCIGRPLERRTGDQEEDAPGADGE